MPESYLPCSELLEVLKPAYAPCQHFSGACAGCAQWSPERGFIPRGFIGAFGNLEEVELVLLVAEPGNPLDDEQYPATQSISEMLNACCGYVFEQFETGRNPFHQNIRFILDACWPGLDLREQLRKTWITETCLCSAPVESGPVRNATERACRDQYLIPQLNLLKGRLIVALGTKAQNRLNGSFDVLPANHPSSRKSDAEKQSSWAAIAAALAQKRGRPAEVDSRQAEPAVPNPPTAAKEVFSPLPPPRDPTQAALAFIKNIQRPVGRKPRHDGFSILHSDGKRLGFVAFRGKGMVRVYVNTAHSDPAGRFEPQPKNEDDRSFGFNADNRNDMEYALTVLRSAWDQYQPR